MAVITGQYDVPSEHVSITDGARQVQFDTPGDMVDWLERNPDVARDLQYWSWTTREVGGGHLSG
jgi:hypothetical protein